MKIIIEEGIVSRRKEMDLYFLMKETLESFTDIFGKTVLADLFSLLGVNK